MLCERRNRNLAASIQGGVHSSFGGDLYLASRIVQASHHVGHVEIVLSAFNTHDALPGCREHRFGLDCFLNSCIQTQPLESRHRQYNGIVFPLVEFGEPRIDVAPEVYYLQVRTPKLDLALTPQTR